MALTELLLLILLFLIIAYWWNAMRAKELVHQKGRQRCVDLGLTLLDDSFALKKLKLARNDFGRVVI